MSALLPSSCVKFSFESSLPRLLRESDAFQLRMCCRVKDALHTYHDDDDQGPHILREDVSCRHRWPISCSRRFVAGPCLPSACCVCCPYCLSRHWLHATARVGRGGLWVQERLHGGVEVYSDFSDSDPEADDLDRQYRAPRNKRRSIASSRRGPDSDEFGPVGKGGSVYSHNSRGPGSMLGKESIFDETDGLLSKVWSVWILLLLRVHAMRGEGRGGGEGQQKGIMLYLQ